MVGSTVAALATPMFAILSVFVTVFTVSAGAGLAGVTPDEGGFIALAAAIPAGAAIAAGASPMTGLGSAE